RDGLREFANISVPDEPRYGAEVVGVGRAAEDDLDNGRVPDRARGLASPSVPGLSQRLEDDEGGDPRAAALGDERRKAREGIVGSLVQDEREWWVEACPCGCGGNSTSGIDDV